FNRSERTPSVKVDLQKNLFYDFGSGEGGTTIDLVITLFSFRGAGEAITYLKEFSHSISSEQKYTPHPSTQNTKERKLIILSERPLNHPLLLKYIMERNV